MKNLLFLVALIAIFTFLSAQECQRDDDCNYVETWGLKKCDRSGDNPKCADKESVAYKDTVTGNKYCKDSLRFGAKCGKYAGPECKIPTEERAHKQCVTGTKLDGDTCKVPTTNDTVTYKKENEECGEKDVKCEVNLICNRKVCRKPPAVGELCSETLGCAGNAICNLGVCTIPHSVDESRACTESKACKSGKCDDGYCVRVSREKCFKDSDCSGNTMKKCNRVGLTDDNAPGVCFLPLNVARTSYDKCMYNCYQKGGSDKDFAQCMFDSCKTEYVTLNCAQACPGSPDTRFGAATHDGKSYKIDCKAKDVVEIKSGECEIPAIYENCDAYVTYSSASTITIGMSAFLLAIVALLF